MDINHRKNGQAPCHNHAIGSTVPSTRRGRIPTRKSVDIHPEASYGDTIHQKDPKHLRIFFQNVKGLSHTSTTDDYQYYANSIRELQVDICGLAETNKPWQILHHRQDFLKGAKSCLGNIKVEFASPQRAIDPVDDNDNFQAGGCLTMVCGRWVPCIHGSSIADTSGLGRWSGITIRGKQGNVLSVITAYRTCQGHINTAPLGSSYAREYEFYKRSGQKRPNPRKHFVDELRDVMRSLQRNGHQLILGLDANSLVDKDQHFQDMLDSCDLHDLHATNCAPSTYIGSRDRRIDYIFGCSTIARATVRSGTLSYFDGPQADHRALFIDVDTAQTLHFNPTDHHIPSALTRDLKTGNPELVENYVAKMHEYYMNHNMEERIHKLSYDQDRLSRAEIREALEKWDADQGRAMHQAESFLSRPNRPYNWSPNLRNAGCVRRYWKLRMREHTKGEVHTDTFQRIQKLIQEHDPSFCLPYINQVLTLEAIRRELNQSTKALRQIQLSSVDLRHQFYEDLLAKYQNDTDPVTSSASLFKAKIVENTIRAEQCRAMFRNIRSATKPNQRSAGLQQINVPRPHQDEHIPANSHEVLSRNDSRDIVWEKILDPAEIESHLLRYNHQSFRAAAVSPCGHGLIHDTLTFTSLSNNGDNILKGIIPEEWEDQPDLLKEFLLSFAMPPAIPQITSSFSEEQVRRGFKTWKETTSTSPSGRHLGHYRAIVSDNTLRYCLTTFLNIAIKHGISIKRWQNATNIMIEKDEGRPNINRLRIIHLFEADLNLFLKIQWARRLIRHATKYKLLHPSQHGSIPGRTTMDPIMLTQLTNELCRTLKHNLARFDNDASACYDRIIVALAMLAARRCGMPANAVRSHAETLQYMRYSVKTYYGITQATYSGTIFEPLFGTGQGSGASPAAWLSLVVVIMNTIDKVTTDRMHFTSIDGHIQHSRLMDAYVDDTAIGITCTDDTADFDSLVAKLEQVAQTWEQLLFYSGGALNLSKCSWNITYWEWINGVPTNKQPDDTTRPLRLTQAGSTETTKIRHNPDTDATRILGVHLASNGDFTTQLQVLQNKADTMARSLQSPRLTRQDILTYHRTMYTPSMKYALPAIAADEEELDRVQSKVMGVMLQRLGFSSKTPKALRHGPPELGGARPSGSSYRDWHHTNQISSRRYHHRQRDWQTHHSKSPILSTGSRHHTANTRVPGHTHSISDSNVAYIFKAIHVQPQSHHIDHEYTHNLTSRSMGPMYYEHGFSEKLLKAATTPN